MTDQTDKTGTPGDDEVSQRIRQVRLAWDDAKIKQIRRGTLAYQLIEAMLDIYPYVRVEGGDSRRYRATYVQALAILGTTEEKARTNKVYEFARTCAVSALLVASEPSKQVPGEASKPGENPQQREQMQRFFSSLARR